MSLESRTFGAALLKVKFAKQNGVTACPLSVGAFGIEIMLPNAPAIDGKTLAAMNQRGLLPFIEPTCGKSQKAVVFGTQNVFVPSFIVIEY